MHTSRRTNIHAGTQMEGACLFPYKHMPMSCEDTHASSYMRADMLTCVCVFSHILSLPTLVPVLSLMPCCSSLGVTLCTAGIKGWQVLRAYGTP